MQVEFLSFILGICVVLMVAMAAGSIFAIVKVIKVDKQVTGNVWRSNEEFDKVKDEFEKVRKEIEVDQNEIYRTIDSRSDKLYEKIAKDLNPKHRILQLINNDPSDKESENKK